MSRPVRILWLLSILIGLVACTVIYFFAQRQGLSALSLMGDEKGYIVLAEHVVQSRVFSFSTQAPFVPESFRAPGYPFFLAGLFEIFDDWSVVLFVQAFLVSVAPVLLYLLFRPYHERAAWWGSIIFVFEPIRLFLSSVLLSDALFVCLLLGSLVLLEKGRERSAFLWYGLAGFVLGAGILVRPIAIFLPLLWMLYILCTARPFKKHVLGGIVFAVVCMGVLAPWSVRNHHLFGSWNISSVGVANLMLYNAPGFLKFRPDAGGQIVLERFQTRLAAQGGAANEGLSLAHADEFTRDFFTVIEGHEMSYAFFHIAKTVPFFVTDGLRDTVRLFAVDLGGMPNISTALLHGDLGLVVNYLRSGGLPIFLLVVGSGFWIVVTCLYACSVYTLIRMRFYRVGFLLVVPVLYFALLTGPVSNARYRLPAEGMLVVGAVASLLIFKEKVRKIRL